VDRKESGGHNDGFVVLCLPWPRGRACSGQVRHQRPGSTICRATRPRCSSARHTARMGRRRQFYRFDDAARRLSRRTCGSATTRSARPKL